MKKSTLSFLAIPVLLAAGVSAAEAEAVCHPGDGPYASIGIGISKTQHWKSDATRAETHFRTAPNFRVAVGSQFSNFRAEFEPSYSNAKYTVGGTRGHANLTSILGNAYVGLPFEGIVSTYPVAPYLGAGIGFSSVKANFSPIQVQNQGHNTVLSYQGIAGVRLALNTQVGLNIEYRYFSTEKLNYIGKRIEAHSANLGLTYRF
jgi:opacity protein-like surface antigen